METERLMIHGGSTQPGSIGQQCSTVDTMAGGRPYRIMVDCGMEFVREDELGMGGIGPTPDFSPLQGGKKIDAVFLTHAHVDHIGSIGALCAGGYLEPEAKIYCSPQTTHIVPIVLNDGLKNHPQYNIFDAADAISRLAVIPAPGECEILSGLKVYIPQRGHIPGNGGIVIPLASGKKGYFTSDECWHNQPVTQASLLPSQSWPIEWIPDEIWGTDLTYGVGPANSSKPKPTVDEEVARLIEKVREGLGNNRKQIIAAFGTGRIQNVAIWLAKAGIRVYIDGIGREIYRIFQENRWTERDNRLPKLSDGSGIMPVESSKHREHLIHGSEPCIVATTGGMGDFGPIVAYLEAGISRNDFDFYFTSWLDPRSNGHKLVELSKKMERDSERSERRVKLKMGEDKPRHFIVRASINHFALSAHSPMEKTVDFWQDIVSCRHGKLLDRIVLTHGVQENKAIAANLFMPFSRQIIYGERNTVVSL